MEKSPHHKHGALVAQTDGDVGGGREGGGTFHQAFLILIMIFFMIEMQLLINEMHDM